MLSKYQLLEIVSFHKFPLFTYLSYGQEMGAQVFETGQYSRSIINWKCNYHLGLFAIGMAHRSLNSIISAGRITCGRTDV